MSALFFLSAGRDERLPKLSLASSRCVEWRPELLVVSSWREERWSGAADRLRTGCVPRWDSFEDLLDDGRVDAAVSPRFDPTPRVDDVARDEVEVFPSDRVPCADALRLHLTWLP